jgi:hypothetical protein
MARDLRSSMLMTTNLLLMYGDLVPDPRRISRSGRGTGLLIERSGKKCLSDSSKAVKNCPQIPRGKGHAALHNCYLESPRRVLASMLPVGAVVRVWRQVSQLEWRAGLVTQPLLRAQEIKARSPQRMGHPTYGEGEKKLGSMGHPPFLSSSWSNGFAETKATIIPV